MNKLLFILIAFMCSFTLPSISHEYVKTHLRETVQTTVYITKTGGKYHTSNCRYLRQSKISISKKEAVSGGYTACSVCKP